MNYASCQSREREDEEEKVNEREEDRTALRGRRWRRLKEQPSHHFCWILSIGLQASDSHFLPAAAGRWRRDGEQDRGREGKQDGGKEPVRQKKRRNGRNENKVVK